MQMKKLCQLGLLLFLAAILAPGIRPVTKRKRWRPLRPSKKR